MYMYVEEWEQIRTCADTCCPTQSQLSDEVMVSMYEKMSVLCYMDQHLYKAQRMVSCSARERISHGVLYCVQGLISFYMMSYGEEGTHFGSAAALHDKDMVYSQYREAGQLCTLLCVVPTTFTGPSAGVLLWRGFSLQQAMHQCFGNCHDLAHGRQMPVHYGSPEHSFQFISSPLATQMPQGMY